MEATWNVHLGTKGTFLVGLSIGPALGFRPPPRGASAWHGGASLWPDFLVQRRLIQGGRADFNNWLQRVEALSLRRFHSPDPSARLGIPGRAGFSSRDAPEGSQVLHLACQRATTALHSCEPRDTEERQPNRPLLVRSLVSLLLSPHRGQDPLDVAGNPPAVSKSFRFAFIPPPPIAGEIDLEGLNSAAAGQKPQILRPSTPHRGRGGLFMAGKHPKPVKSLSLYLPSRARGPGPNRRNSPWAKIVASMVRGAAVGRWDWVSINRRAG
jgi:hypothetical protein